MRPDKHRQPLLALQGVLVRAREMAHDAAPDLAQLLDDAEYPPTFIADPADQTAVFRGNLAQIAARFRCAYVLEAFDRPASGP
jgi:hypothetical protein